MGSRLLRSKPLNLAETSADAFFQRSDAIIATEALCAYLPQFCIDLMRNLPNPQMIRLKEYMKVAREVALDILAAQSKEFAAGKEGSKDVMSLLSKSLYDLLYCYLFQKYEVRANLSQDPKKRLSDEEIIAQLT